MHEQGTFTQLQCYPNRAHGAAGSSQHVTGRRGRPTARKTGRRCRAPMPFVPPFILFVLPPHLQNHSRAARR